MKRWSKRLVWALVLGTVAGLLFLMFRPQPVQVEVATVLRGPLQVTVDGTGKVRVRDRYVVSAPVSGQLARITLRAGDVVQAQQLLAQITPLDAPLLDPRTRAELGARLASARSNYAQAQTAIERARLAAEQAKRDWERAKVLADAGSISPQDAELSRLQSESRGREVRLAELAAQTAQGEVAAAQATVKRFEPGQSQAKSKEALGVSAPIEGRVLRVLQESSGPVQAGMPLVELADVRSLELVVDLLTTAAVKVRPGDTAKLDQWGGSQVLQGKVSRIEPSAFTKVSALGVEEQRVNVIVEPAPEPSAWQELGDGYQVEAHIVVWQEADTTKVPISALFRRKEGWALFVAEKGQAVLRPIALGQRSEAEAQVLDGAWPGEQVVLYPGDKVHEGTALEWAKSQESAKAASSH